MSIQIIPNSLARLSAALCLTAVAWQVAAVPLTVRPVELGDGLRASGTVVTDDATGHIVDWNLAVRSTTRLAHYTRANTPSLAVDQVSVSADGQRLSVATSPDPVNVDGGQLLMRSPNPSIDFGAALADFTGSNAAGGQAFYLAGGAFDFLALGAANGSEYTVATQNAAGSRTYDLAPVIFNGGVTLFGTLVTDGTLGGLGAANILGWDVFVDQVFEDLFDKSNSLMSAAQIAFDPSLGAVLVNNPGGSLAFNKSPLGGRAHALVLADFTDPLWPTGKAAYYQGRLSINERALGAGRGAWRVTGNNAVLIPEPGSLALAVGGLVCAASYRRKSARALPTKC